MSGALIIDIFPFTFLFDGQFNCDFILLKPNSILTKTEKAEVIEQKILIH